MKARNVRNRLLLLAIYIAPAALTHAQLTHAQSYPTRPVRIVVGFSAGSTGDRIARIIADGLTDRLKQNFIVDNRAGAGGNIGVEIAAKSPADGYTLLIASITMAISPALYQKLPYDSTKDFSPISMLGNTPNVLVVNPAFPANSVKELIALAKAKPGQLSFGSSGNGTAVHLSGELFNYMAGVKMLHVPYKGPTEPLRDIMAGRVDLMFANLTSVQEFIRARRLKALGVTSVKRHPSLPDVPTISESGLSGYQTLAWFGVVAPAATPKPIIAKLNASIVEFLGTKNGTDRLFDAGLDAVSSTPEQLDAYLRDEIARWAMVVKLAGTKID